MLTAALTSAVACPLLLEEGLNLLYPTMPARLIETYVKLSDDGKQAAHTIIRSLHNLSIVSLSG